MLQMKDNNQPIGFTDSGYMRISAVIHRDVVNKLKDHLNVGSGQKLIERLITRYLETEKVV